MDLQKAVDKAKERIRRLNGISTGPVDLYSEIERVLDEELLEAQGLSITEQDDNQEVRIRVATPERSVHHSGLDGPGRRRQTCKTSKA